MGLLDSIRNLLGARPAGRVAPPPQPRPDAPHGAPPQGPPHLHHNHEPQRPNQHMHGPSGPRR